MEWSKHSGRSAEAPFGVARLLAGSALEPTERAWYEYPTPGTHAKLIYNYSTGPWNIVDLCYPNFWGQAKPIVTRMSRLISSEEMFWTTSIYCGLLAFLTLCLTPWCRQWNRWWCLGVVASLLAFGHFGIVAGIQNLKGATAQTPLGQIEPGLGTPYWFLVTFFPGYASFRYPSKWMPAAALGMSVALSLWFSHADAKNLRRLERLCFAIIVLGISIAVLCLVPGFRHYLVEIEKPKATIDQYFGPLNLPSAFFAVQWACIHGCLFAGFLWYRTRQHLHESFEQDHRYARHLLMFVALDFIMAGYSWIEYAPRNRATLAELDPQVKDSLRRDAAVGSSAVLRTLDDKKLMTPWMSCSSPMRSLEVDINEQRTLMSLWSLPYHLVMINASPTITPRVHTSFWAVVGEMATRYEKANPQFKSQALDTSAAPPKDASDVTSMSPVWHELLRWMSVRAVVTMGPPVMEYTANGEPIMVNSPNWSLVENPLPTIRWYDKWEAAPGASKHPTQTWERLGARLLQGNADSHPAWIELPQEALPKGEAETASSLPADIHLIGADAESVHVEVSNTSAGWVYFHVFQDGNWRAELKEKEGKGSVETIKPAIVNLIGQGIYLEPGHWEIQLSYQPRWLIYGTFASALGWLAIGYLAFRARVG